eukprot:TRINITY_DN6362_c0_g1_i1.p1 TRINITY_DN6362_c0_g1~~TRINITY_DN6362_c0_g1_i1.p1  ORF type:complete len:341 (+),score=64.48 TRINITY_DN6362_c0_g1_i1:730-1752(+)
MSENVKILLIKRPSGLVQETDFQTVLEPVKQPAQGQFLVKNLYLSLDPAMRGWMTEAKSYLPPVQLGDVMRGLCVAQVVSSLHDKFSPGDLVTGTFGWQTYAITDGKGVQKVPNLGHPVTVWLGALGMTGMTAYFGLLDVGKPKAGDTVVVSGAAGATGSVVGQIAKIKGCRVVGIAGSADKCKWLVDTCGFDAAINYKTQSVPEELKKSCPNGVDVYFDNVGGDILDHVLAKINRGARVVLCGAISQYNSAKPVGPKNYLSLLVNRAKMEGFIVLDYVKQYQSAVLEISEWIKKDKLRFAEQIVDGLENAPKTLQMLFRGENSGKLIIRIAPGDIKARL